MAFFKACLRWMMSCVFLSNDVRSVSAWRVEAAGESGLGVGQASSTRVDGKEDKCDAFICQYRKRWCMGVLKGKGTWKNERKVVYAERCGR